MQFLTDFADQAVVLPLAACLIAWAWATGWRRGARAAALALAATFGAVLLLKMALARCDPAAGLRSPSGHTAAAALVYGGGAALLLRRPWPQAALLAALAAFVIAASRLALQVHSVADVLTGAAIGVSGAVLLIALAGPRPRGARLWPLGAAALGCAVLLHGQHAGLEAVLRHLAFGLFHREGC
jgi:membrane-associated phospholipid phosphatase